MVLRALLDPELLEVLEYPDNKNAISKGKTHPRALAHTTKYARQHFPTDWQRLLGSPCRPSRPPHCLILEVPVSREIRAENHYARRFLGTSL